MPEIKEAVGNHWQNCIRADQFKDDDPENFKKALTLLAALQDIRIRKAELQDEERELVHEIFELMPKKEMDFGGIGRVTRAKSNNRKWDHDSLIPVIVARALDDRKIDKETGEVFEREASAVARVMAACAGIGYWRLTALKEYGIDPDEYYETTSSRTSIRIQD